LIDWYRNRYRDVVRDSIRKLKKSESDAWRGTVNDAVRWFNRDGDVQMLRDAMVQRFATYIEKEPLNPDANYSDSSTQWAWTIRSGNPLNANAIGRQLRLRDDAAMAIDAGHVEAINTGIGIRIIQTLGTLHTEPDAVFQFVAKGTDDTVDDVEDLMSEVRQAGSFQRYATEMDLLSCMVESAWLHIYYKGNELRYDALPPSAVWIKYGSKIVYVDRDGNETRSWVDYRSGDLDDASAIIIQLAASKGDYDSSPDKQQYLAYVGCCDDFPEGRYVIYRAREPWPIPDGNTREEQDDIEYDHMEGNPSERCNPLTWLRHHGTDKERELVTTEYPLVLWRGGHRVFTSDFPPITTSLYEECIELEMGWSRVLRYALAGAQGVNLLKLADGEIRVPKSLENILIGERDEYQKTGWPASNAKDASDVMAVITEQAGLGFNCPGYQIVGHLAGNKEWSGIALAIQTAPLTSFRSKRHAINDDAMTRVWEIERALLVQGRKEARGLLTGDVEQRWDPGSWRMPGSELEDLQAQKEALDQGLDDQVMAVKRRHRLKTDSESEELIEKMKERDPGYPDNKTSSMFDLGVRQQRDETLSSQEEVVDAKASDSPIDSTVTATEDVQKQALNGAQITAIAEMASQVARGELTPEAAIEILVVAIPGLDRESAKRMVGKRVQQQDEQNIVQSQ
jgi:hypothetical protein